jgi:hypothetical protein
VIGKASFHRRGNAQRLVNPAEVVVREMERHGVGEVLDFLGERIGKARKPAHAHPHREVLALDVGRRNVFLLGFPAILFFLIPQHWPGL